MMIARHHPLHRFARSTRASVSIEFAIVIPILLAIVAGTADYGRGIYQKFRLESAVSASANYTIVNATQAASATAPTLVGNTAALLLSNTSPSITGKVLINSGRLATLAAGAVTQTGSAATADSCYCPTYAGGVVSWGAAVTCATACGTGGLAGKFVEITAQQHFDPMFVGSNRTLVSRAMVQVQ
jgi:Flp pilus assembly protein TadG